MAARGDALFDEHDEAGEAVEELTEGSFEDGAARPCEAADAEVPGAAPAAIDDAHGSVGEGNGNSSDGAARPCEAATATAPPGSCGAASGSSAPNPPPLTMKGRIFLLKEEQKQLRATSKAKTREIRNAERRSKRLKGKVGGLTDEDLNEVLRARAEAKGAAAKHAATASRATAKGESRSSPLKRGATCLL